MFMTSKALRIVQLAGSLVCWNLQPLDNPVSADYYWDILQRLAADIKYITWNLQ